MALKGTNVTVYALSLIDSWAVPNLIRARAHKNAGTLVSKSLCGRMFLFVLGEFLEVKLMGHQGRCKFNFIRN